MQTFDDVRRVLRPGGSLHVVDFGRPAPAWEKRIARLAHRTEHIRDNVEGLLLTLLSDAGFAEVRECGRHATIAGGLSFYRAGASGSMC